MMSALATWLSNLGAVFVRGSLLQVVEVIITFYLLFHFLRNRMAAKVKMVPWPTLANPKTGQLLPRVAKTIHAIVYGTLAVAAVQGNLSCLMF
jgi:predicted PurR-regulated permease PerM